MVQYDLAPKGDRLGQPSVEDIMAYLEQFARIAAGERVNAHPATSRRQPFSEVNMGTRIDITGQRFGRLVAIQRSGSGPSGTLWLCDCDCGKEAIRPLHTLHNGTARSCGCLRAEVSGDRTRTHGLSRTRLWNTWCGIRNRAGKAKGYEHVTVCFEWLTFPPFRDWALANGYTDALSIDRIANDKGYEPNNCRWATAKEQVRNSSKVKPVVRSDGECYATATDAAAETGCNLSHIIAACRGRRSSAGGFGWSYAKEI